MKKLFSTAVVCGLLAWMPASAASLVVSSSAAPSGAEYNYSYTVSISGTGLSLTDIFVTSDDLSPLNVKFTFDGASTTNWSWLSGNTPRNYLDFFDSTGVLGTGDTLKIAFSSFLAPAASQFAIGENLNNNPATASNIVSSVIAPTAAVPEPASAGMLLFGLGAILFATTRLRLLKRQA
ncbi:MAG: PEP-CTERM sorting domain-containing protein [Acidobacteriaceae bacterium]|nr:PEP-CTERM sorting domain-containing protein [Acidobacteriaceae bacterium]